MSIFSKTFILGVLFAISISFAHAAVELVTAKDASTLYADKKAVIVDVREDNEWNDEHIAGALHIPLAQLNARVSELQSYKDKDTTIITQCKSGGRSAQALELLKAAGFTKVYSMDGGIKAWDQQGLATTK
jgi:rhodanese-related sulfurtransferase